MKAVRVEGKNNVHKVLMYALSTCAWCRMNKKFLQDSGVEYEYIDVDLCSDNDKEKIREDILSRGANVPYPTLIIDGKIVITGFRKDKIMEILGI